MKLARLSIASLMTAAVLFLGAAQFALADDTAGLFKTKCAMCHGTEGQGKIGPALKGTTLTEAQISDLLSKGQTGKKAPHAKPLNGITDDQAKALAAFVKTLK